MGRKRTPEEVEQEHLERQKRGSVKQHHQELQEKIQKLIEDREFVKGCLSSPPVFAILSRFGKEIEADKERLVLAEKKDIEGLQACVKARRALLNILQTAYEDDLTEARSQLREFEQSNALFLTADEDGVTEEAMQETLA